MIYNSFKLLVFLVLLFALLIFGKNGCRQCHGWQTISFTKGLNKEQATKFFRTSIEKCATGTQYEITLVSNDYCGSCSPSCLEEQKVCLVWRFYLQVWRYCGNGYRAEVIKEGFCNNGFCAANDFLSLVCTKSVDCIGTCDCKVCGCK